MVTRKDLIVTSVLTFCLTAMLFMIVETRSAYTPYNPWADINGDGKVSLSDLVILANCYGTNGTPIARSTPYINPYNQSEYAYPRILALNLTKVYILGTQGWENETDLMWGGWNAGRNVTYTLSLNMAFFDAYASGIDFFNLGLSFTGVYELWSYYYGGHTVAQNVTKNGKGCLTFMIVPALNDSVNWLDTSAFGYVEIASLSY